MGDSENFPPNKTDGSEMPPLRYGLRRIHYQFSVTLPLIHLTLASIIQGIAFSAVIDQIPNLSVIASDKFIDVFISNSYFIPHIICAALIILVWLDYCDAAVNLIWPFSFVQAALIFLIGLAEVLAIKSIPFFPSWLMGIGLIGLFGGFVHWNNNRLESATLEFEDENIGRSMIREEVVNGILFMLQGLFAIGLGVSYALLINAYPTVAVLLKNGFLLIICVLVGVDLFIDRRVRLQRLQHVVKDSDLLITKLGVLRYKNKYKRPDPGPIPDIHAVAPSPKVRLYFGKLAVTIGWGSNQRKDAGDSLRR